MSKNGWRNQGGEQVLQIATMEVREWEELIAQGGRRVYL
jgi:hypothetical protein